MLAMTPLGAGAQVRGGAAQLHPPLRVVRARRHPRPSAGRRYWRQAVHPGRDGGHGRASDVGALSLLGAYNSDLTTIE
jgi:hypothetical protein